MKKLLTVSVLAIMAVSTANAEIASTSYVGTRTGEGTGTGGVFKAGDFNGAASEKTNLRDAINAVADAVGDTDVVTTYETKVDASSKLTEAKGYTDTKIQALDLDETGGDAKYIKSVTQVDGKVTVEAGDFSLQSLTNVPTECATGVATCALVYDSETPGFKWESIMK